MRIDVQFRDRLGIAQEILGVVAEHGLNVVAVEVDPPHVYVDAPGLSQSALGTLRDALMTVANVTDINVVDLLPGARRRLHLDALLAAMPDPVLLVDAAGIVIAGNTAAMAATGRSAATLPGAPLHRLIDSFPDPHHADRLRTHSTADALTDPQGLRKELLAAGFRLAPREVFVGGEPYLLDCRPTADAEGMDGTPAMAAGGIVTLRLPERLGEELQILQPFRAAGFESLLGVSPVLQALRQQGARFAQLDAPVLILGETGTGKELVAHACHTGSHRKDAPFFALNCAAVPESLAESELFGYASGAFSGAQRGGKPGLLELANGGTVLLDEVGEMSPYLQAKLLRFLNDGTFRRVGGAREIKVDVRIIAATHRDLTAMVADQTFREDLYYRLNVLRLEMPPLRIRGDDIVLLARHFIQHAAIQVGRPRPSLSPAARQALLSHPWPGNVRQLQNVLFRAVTMCEHSVLGREDLDLSLPGHATPSPATARVSIPTPSPEEIARDADTHETWEAARDAFEEAFLASLYPRYPSSRKLAARLHTSHTMIANKLRKYGLSREV